MFYSNFGAVLISFNSEIYLYLVRKIIQNLQGLQHFIYVWIARITTMQLHLISTLCVRPWYDRPWPKTITALVSKLIINVIGHTTTSRPTVLPLPVPATIACILSTKPTTFQPENYWAKLIRIKIITFKYSPYEILAMAAECRLLEKPRDKLVAPHFVNNFLAYGTPPSKALRRGVLAQAAGGTFRRHFLLILIPGVEFSPERQRVSWVNPCSTPLLLKTLEISCIQSSPYASLKREYWRLRFEPSRL